MHPKTGDTVYYIPQIVVVESEIQARVFRLEVKKRKDQTVAAAGTLFPWSLVEKAGINEARLAAIREQKVALLNERNNLVYQKETLQQELLELSEEGRSNHGAALALKGRNPSTPAYDQSKHENNC